MLNQDLMREATRLTRAGQLVEATALIQRMLSDANSSGATSRPSQRSHPGQMTLPGREPLVIDGEVNPTEKAGRPRKAPATSADPQMFRELLGRARPNSNLGLHGVVKRVPPSTREIMPEGTQFIEGSYRNAAGQRAYRLFIPSRYRGQPLPLVVMLHGCTQTPEDFAAGTRMNFTAEEENCFVVYPAQHSKANQSKCWNWFRRTDQQRGSGEPSLIAGITRQIMREYSIDPARVYVGGLSAGAAAAVVMGATYNDLYAAVGVHSGLACGAASDLPSAFVAMRQGGGNVISHDGPTVPTVVFHGDRDATVHPANGHQVLEQSAKAPSTQKTVHRGRVPGGHAYTRTIHGDASGRAILEHWNIHGAGHAWAGGSVAGSYTDPRGPDATKEMLRFFLEHSR